MVLDTQRQRLDWWLVPMAKGLRNVNPNTFTWTSLVAALFGGYAFYRSGPDATNWLLVGFTMVLLNAVLDLLDGKVAKITGQQTKKGDYLDHAIDRFADVSFIGGLALSEWLTVEWGMAALVFTLLTSYLGTQAQAVGIGRNYGGLLGRADRMVLLLVVPLAQWIYTTQTGANDLNVLGYGFTLLGWMIVYFAAVGLLTTVQRFVGGLRSFGADGDLK